MKVDKKEVSRYIREINDNNLILHLEDKDENANLAAMFYLKMWSNNLDYQLTKYRVRDRIISKNPNKSARVAYWMVDKLYYLNYEGRSFEEWIHKDL